MRLPCGRRQAGRSTRHVCGEARNATRTQSTRRGITRISPSDSKANSARSKSGRIVTFARGGTVLAITGPSRPQSIPVSAGSSRPTRASSRNACQRISRRRRPSKRFARDQNAGFRRSLLRSRRDGGTHQALDIFHGVLPFRDGITKHRTGSTTMQAASAGGRVERLSPSRPPVTGLPFFHPEPNPL